MAENYYIYGYTKEPIWTSTTKEPSKRRKEKVYFFDGRNFEETVEKADKFCADYGITVKNIRRSYKNWTATVLESEDAFNKRVETWTKERAKYKILREKWLAKKKQDEVAAAARTNVAVNNDGEYVVVKLTPAQYSRLVNGTR